MKVFKEEAQKVADEHKHVFSPNRGPIYSFDNAPVHQGADLNALGLVGPHRAPLPPSSPDMHKCIEHVFGTLTRAMEKSLHKHMELSTAAEYRAEVERLFKTIITPASVQKDVATLKDTYIAIRDEVAGDWPARHLR